MRYCCNRQSDLYLYHNCDMNELGKRLRDARNARELTQKDLARKSGVSRATISDIERGRNESSKELPLLAKALGMSVDELLTGRGDTHHPYPANPPPDGEGVRFGQ